MSLTLVNRDETLYQLFPGELLGRLANGITTAVQKSFADQEGRMRRDIPRIEIVDRFKECVRWARTLRGDLQWGVDRIVGQLDEILRCHLARIDYVPTERKCWMPSDGK
jgi:hypothetical protein